MPIFKIKDKKFSELKSKTPTERELEELVDENLYDIFGLQFIKREFGGQGLFIDTIAYDPETKAPVLIEYKKDTYQSVVDQGMAYLHWLLTHKGDYQVALSDNLGKKEVEKVTQQVKTYTLEDHLQKASERIKELFGKLQKLISSLDERIQAKPVSWYVGYKIRYANFCSVSIYRDKLRIYVRKGKIDDPKNMFKKVPTKWKLGKTSVWYTDINSDKDLEYVLSIIKQGYQSAPDL